MDRDLHLHDRQVSLQGSERASANAESLAGQRHFYACMQ